MNATIVGSSQANWANYWCRAGALAQAGPTRPPEAVAQENGLMMPRLIYSLLFTFESPPPTIVQLVVPLNRDGQAANGLAKAVPPKQRIIDLRIGDWLRFRDTVRKIVAVEAYRDARWEGDWRTLSPDGYIVREAS